MNIDKLTVEQDHMRKLLSLASGDAALLYLYLHSGNPLEGASRDLGLQGNSLALAEANLRQLGLWTAEAKATFVPGERPVYSETDLITAMDTDKDFRSLYSEIERQFGKALTTEELKLLLGINRYLGLSNDVISVLVCYCKERSRQRGNNRNPSLRSIEKEAYHWAEQGIETLEQAAAYINRHMESGDRVLCFEEELPLYQSCQALAYGREDDVETLSAGLFAALRELDENGVTRVYARCPVGGGIAYAVQNRLKKAAAFQVINAEELV